MKAFRSWAGDKGLRPSETHYVARTPGRPTLRFSVSGDPTIERLYCTHWVSPELSERKRGRLAEEAERPELVVVEPLHRDWKCHRCAGSGVWLVMENAGPACLACVGLGDLVWLPAGDTLLTRRAKAKSARHAVVVRFSRPASSTNARVCWSSRRPWRMPSVRWRRRGRQSPGGTAKRGRRPARGGEVMLEIRNGDWLRG